MFKLTVNKKDGDQIILETEDSKMVLGVLRFCDVANVTSDAPNLNTDKYWQDLLQQARAQDLPMKPFTITC